MVEFFNNMELQLQKKLSANNLLLKDGGDVAEQQREREDAEVL